jgi:phospholipid/cholesterol/gamma-HCH transport system substrate-binding protein
MLVSVGDLANNMNTLIVQNKDNIRKLTTNLSGQGSDFFRKANNIFVRMDSSLLRINRLLANKSLYKSFKNMEDISSEVKSGLGQGRLTAMMKNLNKTLESSNKTITQLNRTIITNRERLNQIMEKLEVTVRNLSDFTQMIKENPSLLIRRQED